MTDVLIETAHGTLLGRRDDGLAVVAGVPFAAPPTGELRLAPPQPPAPWTGVRKALAFPPAPAQGTSALRPGRDDAPPPPAAGPARHFAQHLAAVAAAASTSSEDCLYLNVWTPDPGGSRPVLVYLYGGGFDSGSASPPITDGAALARGTGCVVVTVNYRVGALGFLHLADLGGSDWAGSTNLGLQDQAAALHWIRDNITAFGGDRNRITVAGQSAGAFSIGALLAMPSATGTFRRAILHSGSTQRVFPADTATAIAEDLLVALELEDVDGLREVPVKRILAVQNSVIDGDIGRRNLPGGRSWGVVLDGTVLRQHPQDALTDGAARAIALLVGANRDEIRLFQRLGGDAFRPTGEAALLAEIRGAGFERPTEVLDAYRQRLSGPDGAPDLADLRAAFLGDQVYREPATRMAAAQTAAGGTAYSYLFADEPFGPALGAFHGCDGIYLFNQLAEAGIASDETARVRDELQAAWAQFTATGRPGWRAYEPGAAEATRQFGGSEPLATEPPQDEVTAARVSQVRG